MRYANPAYLKTVLEKIDKAIKTYKEEEFEKNAIRVNKEYDQAEREYFKRLEEEIIYGDNINKEDEISNLLTWVRQDEIDQKAHGAVVLDGDHVYPLPVSAESIRIDPDTIPF